MYIRKYSIGSHVLTNGAYGGTPWPASRWHRSRDFRVPRYDRPRASSRVPRLRLDKVSVRTGSLHKVALTSWNDIQGVVTTRAAGQHARRPGARCGWPRGSGLHKKEPRVRDRSCEPTLGKGAPWGQNPRPSGQGLQKTSTVTVGSGAHFARTESRDVESKFPGV